MARTRGRDSLGPAKQRGRRKRVVHVLTEGLVTEPTYIEIIRAQGVLKDPTMAVEVRIANASAPGSQRKPLKLVEAAVRLMREENREAKRSGLDKLEDGLFLPQVWCLFDRDEHEGMEIDMPIDLTEQRRIVDSLHSCDKQIEDERAELAKLRALKLGLVDDLLAGSS